MSPVELPVRVLASFTATPMEPALHYWWSRLALTPAPQIAPYGQLIQPLLTAADEPAATVLLLRWEDWLRHRPGSTGLHRAAVVLEHRLGELAEALTSTALPGRGPVVVIVCPPSPAWNGPRHAGMLAYLDEQLRRLAAAIDGVQVHRAAPMALRYRPSGMSDPRADDLGHMPYQPAYFSVLATVVVRAVLAATTRPRTDLLVDPLRTWYDPCGPRDGDELWRRTLTALTAATGRLNLIAVRAGMAAGMLVDAHHDLRWAHERARLRCLAVPEPASGDPVAAVRLLAGRGLLDPARAILFDSDPATAARARTTVPELAVVTTGDNGAQAADAIAHSWVLDPLAAGTRPVLTGPAYPAALPPPATDATALHREVLRWRRATDDRFRHRAASAAPTPL